MNATGLVRFVRSAPGLETRGYNSTKSAFADYAEPTVREAADRAAALAESEIVAFRTDGGDESAKADFVSFQPGVFNPG